MKTSKLLLPTFDAQITKLKIRPKCRKTKVSYKIKMYDETLPKRITKKMCFEDVAAVEFHMNYFDNPIGAETAGFYEIYSRKEKIDMLERNFLSRKDGFLFHGDYNYDETDEHDILNYRESIEDIYKNIEKYHLFQQLTCGGSYLLLAKKWTIK